MTRYVTRLLAAALVLLLAPLNACRTAGASTAGPLDDVAVLALGDTLVVIPRWTVLGQPDSVRLTIPGNGSRWPAQTRWLPRTLNATQFTVAPSPVLADGETANGQACVAVAFGGKVTADRCRPWSVTRPGASMDSIVVQLSLVPDSVTVLMGDTVRLALYATYQSGRIQSFMGDYWTNHEAGVHVVTATLGGKTATARIRVLASGNEPPSYQPFLTGGMSRIPPWPRGALAGGNPCPGASWCGRWL